MFDYDISERMIQMTKDSIHFISNKLDGMSEGQKEMYLMQKGTDLSLIKLFALKNKSEKYELVETTIGQMKKDIERF